MEAENSDLPVSPESINIKPDSNGNSCVLQETSIVKSMASDINDTEIVLEKETESNNSEKYTTHAMNVNENTNSDENFVKDDAPIDESENVDCKNETDIRHAETKDKSGTDNEPQTTLLESHQIEKGKEEEEEEQTASSSTAQQNVPLEKQEFLYHLKWFDWKGEQTPIITQNENGPCPLIAIANVLILARKIVLPQMQQIISGKQLMEYIGDCILSEAPKQEGNDEIILNYQQNMQDAIDIMYKLQTGIDVNVKFTGVNDFEFTRECIVFDLLKIALYHGWLVDPQDEHTLKAVGGLSYNQVVEKIIASKEHDDGDTVTEGLVIEDFLNRTASQLTYFGLCELNSTIQEEELCVFFRNNHFSTLYKRKGELFLLVTDQGFLTEPAVVWETLINIEGDGHFVNSNFTTVTLQQPNYSQPKISNSNTQPVQPSNSSQNETPADSNLSQEDRDYLIALSLQHGADSSPQMNRNNQSQNTEDLDRQLALKLQEEERQMVREAQQRQQQQQQRQQQPQQVSNPQNTPSAHPQHQQQSRRTSENQSNETKKNQDRCIIV